MTAPIAPIHRRRTPLPGSWPDTASFPATTGRVGSIGLIWQPSLFAAVGPDLDTSFRALERTYLDDDSWVDHCPRWMTGSEAIFQDLLSDVQWHQRRRWMYDREVDEPRLTSWHSLDREGIGFPLLDKARRVLSTRYEVELDSMGINLYRDGRDSVAWHRDRIPKEVVDPLVALVSLGEPRKFLLRPHGGGASHRFKLSPGDLLVTGGQTQRRFEHSVPKVASSGPRISVVFRHGVK